MTPTEVQELKKRVKNGGSLGDLRTLVEYLHDESQETYNNCTERFEYHQSRRKTFNDILELLPETS